MLTWLKSVKTAFNDIIHPRLAGPHGRVATRAQVCTDLHRPWVSPSSSNDRRWTMWQYEAIAHEGGHSVGGRPSVKGAKSPHSGAHCPV